ncbi:hypothetical protein [Winogradskyella ouciana]|uniref:hypothetical protein n=1 Tax=Winogradskyella ouciana TaxID=2608631 RepID=UPI003D271EFA
MKKIVLITFALFLGLNTFAQRRDRMGNPVVNREPTEKDIENYKRKIEERKEEFIANFLTTLEADEFQKEIIKQYLNSYFDAKQEVLKVKYERNFDREEAVKKLDNSHFKELEELISKDDMAKIKEMIKGNFDEQEVKKEKKKKRKKRKKDKG